jgi:hypothetical protein
MEIFKLLLRRIILKVNVTAFEYLKPTYQLLTNYLNKMLKFMHSP